MTTFTGKSRCKCKTPEHENLRSHGTGAGYSNHGCRCDPCTDANSTKSAAWEKAHPERRRELKRESQARCYARNPEPYRARNARYYANHREEYAAWRRRWRNRNREYHNRQSDRLESEWQTLTRAQPGLVTGRYIPAEDAIVLRDDISLLEIAFMLKRTYGSVVNRRYYLRKVA